MIAVNDAKTKHFFDNRYGTGQSTIDGIIRATNMLAGRQARSSSAGTAGAARAWPLRARGMGAQVIVTEVDPLARPRSGDGRLPGDADGRSRQNRRHLRHRHRRHQRHRCRALRGDEGRRIIANSGHFNVEINIDGAGRDGDPERKRVRNSSRSSRSRTAGGFIVLGEGRLINLAAAEGHPASVMDMSFANQALSTEYRRAPEQRQPSAVYDVPKDVDKEFARLKLASMGIEIDTLTDEQKKYLESWEEGHEIRQSGP